MYLQFLSKILMRLEQIRSLNYSTVECVASTKGDIHWMVYILSKNWIDARTTPKEQRSGRRKQLQVVKSIKMQMGSTHKYILERMSLQLRAKRTKRTGELKMGTQVIANKKDKHRTQLRGVRELWETHQGRNREMKIEFKLDLRASKLINLESRFLVIVYTGEELIIKSKQEESSRGSSLRRKSLSSRSQNWYLSMWKTWTRILRSTSSIYKRLSIELLQLWSRGSYLAMLSLTMPTRLWECFWTCWMLILKNQCCFWHHLQDLWAQMKCRYSLGPRYQPIYC